jgi:hypothetical protein
MSDDEFQESLRTRHENLKRRLEIGSKAWLMEKIH